MQRRFLFPAVVALVLGASAAVAGDAPGRHGATFALFAGSTPALDFLLQSKDVAGPRVRFDLPLGQSGRWLLAPGAAYGVGRWKNTETFRPPGQPGTTSDHAIDASVLDVSLDLLRTARAGDDVMFFAGPGLFYSSLDITVKQTGMEDEDTGPYRTFGAGVTLGCTIALSPTLELAADVAERAGRSSFKRSQGNYDDEYTGITTSRQASLGLRTRF